MAFTLSKAQAPKAPSLVESMQQAIQQEPSLIIVPEGYRRGTSSAPQKNDYVTMMVTVSASATKGASLRASHSEWASNLLICSIARIVGNTMFYTRDEEEQIVTWEKSEALGLSVTLIIDDEEAKDFLEERFMSGFMGIGGGRAMSFEVVCPAEFEAGEGADSLILRAKVLQMDKFQAPILPPTSKSNQKQLAMRTKEVNRSYAMQRAENSRQRREARMKENQSTSASISVPQSNTLAEEGNNEAEAQLKQEKPPATTGTTKRKRTTKLPVEKKTLDDLKDIL